MSRSRPGPLSIISTTLLLLLGSAICFAGTKDSGGGVGFLCREGGSSKVYLADTYSVVRSGAIEKFRALDQQSVFLAAGKRFETIAPEGVFRDGFKKRRALDIGWTLLHRAQSIRYVQGGRLALLGDDFIPAHAIPENCEKVQLAVQDLKTGVVHYDKSLVDRLSPIEIGFLRLHETLIAVRDQPLRDTTPIREGLVRVLASPDFSFEGFVSQLIGAGWSGDEIFSAKYELFGECGPYRRTRASAEVEFGPGAKIQSASVGRGPTDDGAEGCGTFKALMECRTGEGLFEVVSVDGPIFHLGPVVLNFRCSAE